MRRITHLAAGLLVFAAFVTFGCVCSYADEARKPSVELGKILFNDPSVGTNGKACSTCHPSEKKAGELAARGEWFGGRAKTLEQAVNICITGPLEGKPLSENSVELKSIAMYMKSLIKK